MYTIEEEVAMESKIVLLECQKEIVRCENSEDSHYGVHCLCKKENIGFFDSCYLSRLKITKTCESLCPRLQIKLKINKECVKRNG